MRGVGVSQAGFKLKDGRCIKHMAIGRGRAGACVMATYRRPMAAGGVLQVAAAEGAGGAEGGAVALKVRRRRRRRRRRR